MSALCTLYYGFNSVRLKVKGCAVEDIQLSYLRKISVDPIGLACRMSPTACEGGWDGLWKDGKGKGR